MPAADRADVATPGFTAPELSTHAVLAAASSPVRPPDPTSPSVFCEPGAARFTLEVGKASVTAKATDITSEVAWSRWKKIIKCGDAYALQLRHSVLFVPVHAFADPADEAVFRDLASAASAGSPLSL